MNRCISLGSKLIPQILTLKLTEYINKGWAGIKYEAGAMFYSFSYGMASASAANWLRQFLFEKKYH